MAYQRTYFFNFVDEGGITYRLEMYDGASPPASQQDREGRLGKDGCKIKWGSDGSGMFAPLKPSTLSFEFTVWDYWSASYIQLLRTARQERDVYVGLYRETVVGSNSPQYHPLWGGFLLMDLSDDPDMAMPYTITIRAIDGIASLKYIDFVPQATTQNANHEYSRADTYMADTNNSQPTWRTFKLLIHLALRECGPFDASVGSTQTEATFKTAVQWFNGDHPSTSIDPMTHTRANPSVFYERIDMGEDNEPKWKASSCYDVLKAICKAWGMRLVYYKGSYYFIQISLFHKTGAGNQASPVDIPNFTYNISNAVLVGSSDSIERWWQKYQLTLDNTLTSPECRNLKMAGGSYNVLPALKKVTIDFLNVDNNNRFTTFPPIPLTSSIGAPTSNGSYYEFTSMGNFTFDGVNDQDFFQRIYLVFNNTSGFAGQIGMRFTLCARIAGTGSNTVNETPINNGWTHFLFYNTTTEVLEWYGPLGLAFLGFEIDIWFPIPAGASTKELTGEIINQYYSYPPFPAGTGTTNYPLFAAGDYEVGYYVNSNASTTSGGIVMGNWWGTGQFGYGSGANSTNPWDAGVSYTDPAQTAGVGASDFAPIINGAIGSNMTTTSLTQSGDDTAEIKIDDVLFGDTGNNASEGCLQVYDGSTWNASDFAGNWGEQTLTGGNSFSQQLATDIIDTQSENILKFNVTTTLQPQESVYYNDGYADRPQFAAPTSTFKTPAFTAAAATEKRWLMHTGEWNVMKQQWKWVLYEIERFNKPTTTTTSRVGGQNSGNVGLPGAGVPTTNNSARMGNPAAGNSRAIAQLQRQQSEPIATVSTTQAISRTIVEGYEYKQTITSIAVREMPEALLKTGDKILLYTSTTKKYGDPGATEPTDPILRNHSIEFEVSADQAADATSISVTSQVIYQDIIAGDKISFSPKDLITQYQNKTRGSIGGMEVTATSIDGARSVGRNVISFRVEGDGLSSGSYYVLNGEDSTRSGRFQQINTNAPTSIGTQRSFKSMKFIADGAYTIESGKAVVSGDSGWSVNLDLYKASTVDESTSVQAMTLIGRYVLALDGDAKTQVVTMEAGTSSSLVSGDLIVPHIYAATGTGTFDFRGGLTFTLIRE